MILLSHYSVSANTLGDKIGLRGESGDNKIAETNEYSQQEMSTEGGGLYYSPFQSQTNHVQVCENFTPKLFFYFCSRLAREKSPRN